MSISSSQNRRSYRKVNKLSPCSKVVVSIPIALIATSTFVTLLALRSLSPHLNYFTTGTQKKKIPSNNGSDKRKSQLLIHAGPHKTATTTIQTAFELNRGLLYNSSTYEYIGKFSKYSDKLCPPDLSFCIDHGFMSHPTSESIENFDSKMRQLYRDGVSVVISGEGMAQIVSKRRDRTEPILVALQKLEDNFEITIALSYRRYFEWLVSAHNSLQKLLKDRKNKNWPDTRNKLEIDDYAFKYWYKGMYKRKTCPTCTYNWSRFWGPEYHPTEWVAQVSLDNVLSSNRRCPLFLSEPCLYFDFALSLLL
mmetsp:Transcript_29873/g.68535  ORF Transcript_29873/g.68535 Transcript_29873/m.68535 type:complete len:308 (+) Transcript_29873:184-1107(+)